MHFTSPACGEVDALAERGGWGHFLHWRGICGEAPSPTLPHKRERERVSVAARHDANIK
jgi:hypothetical protein